jgi:hypothetical protein
MQKEETHISYQRSLVDISQACHRDDCSQCYQVAQGCEAVSTHIMKASNILEDKVSCDFVAIYKVLLSV